MWEQEIVEYGNVITNNYLILLALSAVLIICIVIYYFSQTFRVGRALSTMSVYQSYQRLSSFQEIYCDKSLSVITKRDMNKFPICNYVELPREAPNLHIRWAVTKMILKMSDYLKFAI